MIVQYRGLTFTNCRLTRKDRKKAIRITEWVNEAGQNLADEGIRAQEMEITFRSPFTSLAAIDAANDGLPGNLIFDSVIKRAARISRVIFSKEKWFEEGVLFQTVTISFLVMSHIEVGV